MTPSRKHIISCLTIGVLAASLTSTVNAASDASIKSYIDSTTVVQGSKATMHIEVLNNSLGGVLVNAPELGTEFNGVEFSDLSVDTVRHGENRVELNYNYTIQAFDPGTVTFPPFLFSINDDTISSEVVALKVLEVDLDSLTDIHPMESVVAIPSRWYDIIPDWWLWIAVCVAAVGLCVVVVLLLRKKKVALSRPEVVTPPYDLAVMRLNDLQSRKLPQSGRDKEYYTELTDILRQYLEGRFGIYAMEMTSTQILNTLRHNKETKPGSELMKQILEIADFVKFAKVRPLPDDNIKSFNSALKFVEDSKPQPEPETPDSDIEEVKKLTNE